jgi:tRNA(Ile)-lysidine synthetase-like protein
MIKKIASDKPNIVLSKYDDLIVYKEYDNLHIHKEDEEYCYKIDDLSNVSIGERFQISDTGKKLEKVVVKKDEFPIYIKSYDGKNKDVNRIFIDKKVPLRQRKNWPMITNKFGTLLLVINIKKFYNILDNLSDEIIEFYVKEK